MWKNKAMEHANAHAPRESCGLVIIRKGREVFFPCVNTSLSDNNFVIDPADYAKAEDYGEIIAVFHSHYGVPSTPSNADLVSCEKTGLKWYIYSVTANTWNSFNPTGYVSPLVGREFVHGTLDCYSIVKDWYKQELDVNLPEPVRQDDWWLKGENLYEDNYALAGFVEVTDSIEKGDVILMQMGSSKVSNHAAVYLGDDLILHHMHNRLSSRDVYGGMYKKYTTKVLRYVKRN